MSDKDNKTDTAKVKPGRLPSPTPVRGGPGAGAAGRQNVVRSLLGSMQEMEATKNHEALLVATSSVVPNPAQPRQTFNQEADDELTESIREQGILQPLIVRKTGSNKYQIVAGERRYRAASQLGLTQLPVIVKDYDDQQAKAVSLIENLQRADLNPLDEAHYFQQLMDEYNFSQIDIAEFVHRSRNYVQTRLKLLEQPSNGSGNLQKVEDVAISEKGNKVHKISTLINSSQSKPAFTTRKSLQKPVTRFSVFIEETINQLPQVEEDGRQYLIEQLSVLRSQLEDLEKKLKG